MTYLCIIDNSQELENAIHYASQKALIHKTDVAFLYPLEPIGMQQWAGVEDIMRSEARTEAESIMRKWAMVVEGLTGERPTSYIKEGTPLEALEKLLANEKDITHLVLAASSDGEKNPLIQGIVTKKLSSLPIPLIIVPYKNCSEK